MRRDYPILEFDPTLEAVIEPAQVIAPVDAPERCVVCFFQDVISKLRQDKALTTIFEEQWEDWKDGESSGTYDLWLPTQPSGGGLTQQSSVDTTCTPCCCCT